MSRRPATARYRCATQPCTESAFFEYDTQRERQQHAAQLAVRPWRCVRHTLPEEVLTAEVPSRTQTLVAGPSARGGDHLFWWPVGAETPDSGFVSGPGFKAYAGDFEPGTRLTVTAQVVAPQITPAADSADGVDATDVEAVGVSAGEYAALAAVAGPGTPMADLVAVVTQIQVRTLREAAAEIEAELVCCDAIDSGDPAHRHQICYWAGAATQLVTARADQLTTTPAPDGDALAQARKDERDRCAQEVRGGRDAFLDSPALDPSWVAGWHAATDHHTSRLETGPRTTDAEGRDELELPAQDLKETNR